MAGHANDHMATARGAGLPQPVPIAAAIPGLALWYCPLHVDSIVLEQCAATLSPPEKARADRFGTLILRARYIAARASLRALLGAALNMSAAAVPLRRGPNGRPQLDLHDHRLDFNLSHTQDVALVAILHGAPPSWRIGVDVEALDRDAGADRLAGRYLCAHERSQIEGLGPDARRRTFIRLWTCKEAMSKATGEGLRAPMAELAVDLRGEPRLIAGPAPYLPQDWRLSACDLTADFVATAALWTRAQV